MVLQRMAQVTLIIIAHHKIKTPKITKTIVIIIQNNNHLTTFMKLHPKKIYNINTQIHAT